MRRMLAMMLCAGAWFAVAAGADEIIVNGKPYKDVLINLTESFYYVQVPDEGRTMSIPIAQVDKSTVKINKDPYYREPLKEKYTANKARRAAGEMKDVDPAFRAAPAGGGDGAGLSLDAVRGAGGGGGGPAGAGLGMPRTQLETTLTNFGFQFQPGPNNQSAISQRPGTSLELLGPPENLTGIVVKASGPAQQVDAGAGQLQILLVQVNPVAAQAYATALGEAKQNGSASASAAGIAINISRKVDGANVNLDVRLAAGG